MSQLMTTEEALLHLYGRSAVNKYKAMERAPKVLATIDVEPSKATIDWDQYDVDVKAWLDAE